MKTYRSLLSCLSLTTLLAGSTAIAEDVKIPVGGKNILKEFDTNTNRQIDRAELSSLGPKTEKTLIKRYDKDLDGTITMKELGVTEEDLVEKKVEKKGGKKKKGKKRKKR